jgi:hypothetical protein
MVKDVIGNQLKVGDLVHVSIGNPPAWEVGKITAIKPGGAIMPLGKDRHGMMAGEVCVELKVSSHFDPSNPVLMDIVKLHQEVKDDKPTTGS